jgi:hypothetical protein
MNIWTENRKFNSNLTSGLWEECNTLQTPTTMMDTHSDDNNTHDRLVHMHQWNEICTCCLEVISILPCGECWILYKDMISLEEWI